MKANRKFISSEDEAVSPVIAVILMVAITVVLAATVYVWVSGFGAQSSTPAKTLSLTSSGPLSDSSSDKNYTISSATPGLKYSDLELTVNGAEMTFEDTDHTAENVWMAWRGTTILTADSVVTAGDQLEVDDDASLSGTTLRVLDASANSVILTITIG